MGDILGKQTMDALMEIQSNVSYLDEENDAPPIYAGCGNGPTNCQNQW